MTEKQAVDRTRYHAQLRASTRTTTLIAGGIALVAFPVWAVFDLVLVPDDAAAFLAVRAVGEVLLLAAWLALRSSRIGGRWPEPAAYVTVLVPQLAIAWMVPRAEDQLEPYLLGFSLVLYACAFVLVARVLLTVLLVGSAAVATAVSVATASPGPEAGEVATIAFYLTTAAALAVAAQAYRYQAGWQQFVTDAALDDERRRNEALVGELDKLSREDALTAVGNRRAWEERVAGELLRARRSDDDLSVIVCDIDHFKAVNDEGGHPAGDRVLRTVATTLARRVRSTDFVARLGGDEFGVVCPGTSLVAAEELAQHLADRLRAASVTASFGVTQLLDGDPDTAVLLQRADDALYRAKATRDTVCAG